MRIYIQNCNGIQAYNSIVREGSSIFLVKLALRMIVLNNFKYTFKSNYKKVHFKKYLSFWRAYLQI